MSTNNRKPNCPPPEEEANSKAKLLDLLTPREKSSVIISTGYNNNEIAACLHQQTHCENHVSNIYHKLEMDDRTQIALLAVRMGLSSLINQKTTRTSRFLFSRAG